MLRCWVGIRLELGFFYDVFNLEGDLLRNFFFRNSLLVVLLFVLRVGRELPCLVVANWLPSVNLLTFC